MTNERSKTTAGKQLLKNLWKPGAKVVMQSAWQHLIKTVWTEETQTPHTLKSPQYKSKGQRDTNDHPQNQWF